MTLLEPRAVDNGNRLHCHIDEQLAEFQHGAEQYLRQVLSNLLANAIKFTEHGQVTLQVQVLEPRMDLQRVRVNVVTMASASPRPCRRRSSIVSPRPAKPWPGATAVPALAWRFASTGGETRRAHRPGQRRGAGQLLLVRAGPGLWPPASNSGAGTPGPVTTENSGGRGRGAEPRSRRGLLTRDGHQVSFAEHAQQALQACAECRFDLILLDVHLPGMSGVELCRLIRATPGLNRETRILALTAGVQPAQVPGYLEAGMQGVLAKPLKLDSLREALVDLTPVVDAQVPEASMDWALLQTHRALLGEQKLQGLLVVLRQAIDQHEAALGRR